MSVTYHIVCTACKEKLWVGQGGHIYKGKEYIKALEEFLYKHLEHNLMFVSEFLDQTLEEAKEFKPKKEEA